MSLVKKTSDFHISFIVVITAKRSCQFLKIIFFRNLLSAVLSPQWVTTVTSSTCLIQLGLLHSPKGTCVSNCNQQPFIVKLSTTSLEVCFLSIWCLYYNNIYIITCANMQCGKEEYKKTALSVANRKVSLKVKPCALPLEMFLLVCLPFGWARLLSSTIYLRFGKLYFRSGLPTFSATGPSICPQLSFSCTSDQHNIRKTTRRILFSTTVVLIYTSKTTSDHNGLRNAMITYTVNLI